MNHRPDNLCPNTMISFGEDFVVVLNIPTVKSILIAWQHTYSRNDNSWTNTATTFDTGIKVVKNIPGNSLCKQHDNTHTIELITHVQTP